jgi:adenine-specific DNA-methyltransferase
MEQNIAKLADFYRVSAYQDLDDARRSEQGQYFTPPEVARFMASMFSDPPEQVMLLDAGAGVGALTAAFVEDCFRQDEKDDGTLAYARTFPKEISVTLYENDEQLLGYLQTTLAHCGERCAAHGVAFTETILQDDFIGAASLALSTPLFSAGPYGYNRAILNPPYKKINTRSSHRQWLRSAGIETSNLYTGFLALVIQLLEPGGELVAITPRSFCNGPYFKPFRELFYKNMAFRRIHLFETRDTAFGADEVLQENIIFHAVKQGERGNVLITTSESPADLLPSQRLVEHDQVINPGDPNLFIHITANELEQTVADRVQHFRCSLADLGLSVSTGKVVDFRAREHLRHEPETGTAPLIYPAHFEKNFVVWPRSQIRKANAICLSDETRPMMLPKGYYVTVKRFSSKEENRRIVAAVYDPERIEADWIGFENHLNVFHQDEKGLSAALAKGLAVFLNSSLVDLYFRQFNGHTQVNATDLRALFYPDREMVERWGETVGDSFPDQKTIDHLIEGELQEMADLAASNPLAAKQKVEEALEILTVLGMPRGQQNARSAMTLLALLNLTPTMDWANAQAPLIGITPIMEFIRDHYGVEYAPNSRETIRRFTMHQFIQGGLVIENPDEPGRPKNSPHWCYQIEPTTLALLRTYGTRGWEEQLEEHLSGVVTLKEQYAQYREMNRVPVSLPDGQEIDLSVGKHSELIKAIVEEFAERFTPGGKVLYLGDTGEKWGVYDAETLRALGVTVDSHGKMPDVVIYYADKDWLVLVEAVTSHGPVDSKRRIELTELFGAARTGLVYVTAFLTRSDLAKYLSEISWETEVWVASAPTHLIHFDGERFLGPYDVS